MASQTQGKLKFEFIIDEEPSFRSRKKITIASGQGSIVVAQLLELSGSEYIKLATPGNAAAISGEAVDATSASKEVIAIVREAKVRKADLDYNSQVASTTDAALEALGIIVQAGPTFTTL